MAAGRIVLSQYFPARDRNGRLVAGAKLYVYLNETTTKASIYSNEAMTTALANPVEANSSGQFPAIWASDATTYTLSITGPDGESIGNPSVFDDYSVSTGAETESVALAEAAATAAEAAYADALAISASGDDAAAIAARAAKAQNLADLADRADATDNLLLADGGTGAVSLGLGDYLRDLPINAAAYGFVPSATDKSAELQAAINAALASGRELYIPAGSYRVDSAVTAYLPDNLSYATTFRAGLRLRGAGSGRTIIDSRVAGDWLLYISLSDGAGGEYAFGSPKFGLGGYVQGLTIRNGAATTGSNGIRLRAQYQFTIRDVHITGLSGVGVKLRCSLGDTDGNNQILLEDVRVENTGGWGLDIGADDGHNENSFTKLNRVFVQNCGTAEQKAITGISQANPGVVTCAGHGFTDGQKVFIAGVNGMTEANTSNYESSLTVTVINANSFSIGVDTTGFTAYTSGGYAIPRTPSSGGVRVKGQITTFQSCGWTINKNRSVWIDGESTLGSDVFFYDSTIENPQIIGLHVQGNRTLTANGLHVYFNAAQAGAPEFWGHLYDGLTNVVSEIEIAGGNVRSTSDSGEAHLVTFQGIGANFYRDTVRIDPKTLHVKQFVTGQTMFKGIAFDPIPQQCSLLVSSATELRLLPDQSYPNGAFMPLRVSYGGAGGSSYSTGAWVPTRIPAAGITISNSGLSASTTYYVYLYAQASTLNAPALELSTTAPTRASDGSGYPVKTGDETRLAVCRSDGAPVRVQTDSSGTPQFVTTNSGWLAPVRLGGESVGTRASLWQSTADRKLRVKTGATLPASVDDANYTYWPTFEFQATGTDPVSLAAGASTTIDVTVTCSSTDYCIGVAFAPGFQGLSAYGNVKTDNTVTVTLTNHTGSTIDLGSSTLYVAVARR